MRMSCPSSQAPSLGRPILFKNMIDCAVKTIYGDANLGIKAQGVRGLYKGLSALLMKMVPCSAIQYASFEVANKFLSGLI